MPSPTYPITGILIQNGQPLPLRRQITAWATDHDNCHQVSLYLRALAELKSKPVEEKLGYFQLAGLPDRNAGQI